VPLIRRPLSALFALLYLLLSAGGEALQHGGGNEGPAAYAASHYHAQGDGDHDCPPPPHDENHCPAYKLSGLGFIPTTSGGGELAFAWTTTRAPATGDLLAPALRSHAPPSLRAPPFG
jgi:hypothetical protein